MHHKILSRYGSFDQAPHNELLIATHKLALELMISCALPPEITESWQPFVKKEEDGKEIRIFRGLVRLFLPEDTSEGPVKSLICCETSTEIAKAIKLQHLAGRIRKFADFEEQDGKVRITVQGVQGLSRLQGYLGEFFRQNNPQFGLPMGLDTEIYIKPQKFRDFGFKKVS